jgi:hypothetical protein
VVSALNKIVVFMMVQGTVTSMDMNTEFKQFVQRKFLNYVNSLAVTCVSDGCLELVKCSKIW